MDANAKPTTPIDAIDSSVISIGSSYGMEPSTGGGPFNRLPNEIMQMIVARLKLDSDVKKLLRLRSVSTKWLAMIEDYCRLKKSLMVYRKYLTCFFSSPHFEPKFFGLVNSKDFVRIILDISLPSGCLRSLPKLFPNIVQLVINCHDLYKTTDIVECLNSLHSLKQLYINGPFGPALFPIVPKLEYFSFDFGYSLLNDDEIDEYYGQLFSHLSPSCVRLRFGYSIKMGHRTMLQWANTNPLLLANLTHLQFEIATSEEYDQVVHFLCERATSLKRLGISSLDKYLDWTPTVIGDVAKLTNLAHLELSNVKIKDISKLEQAVAQHGLTSITSVLTCEMTFGFDLSIEVDQFMRVFNVIFPNLVELNLTLLDFYFTQEEFEKQLYRMPNLRKHSFQIDYD